MTVRAAALAACLSLCASSAFAGTGGGRFMVGVTVVRSATVAATSAGKNGVQVAQVASRGLPPPLVLVAGASAPMPACGALHLPTGAGASTVVTMLY
jgi:hypothetical protein